MIKNRSGLVASLCALLLLALTSTLHAETVMAIVRMTPGATLPPPNPASPDLNVNMGVTLDVTRDASGNVIAGTMGFVMILNFEGSLTISSVHLHDGAVNGTGPVLIDLRLGGITFGEVPGQPGRALIATSGRPVDLGVLQRMLANPTTLYADLHTPANPDGAIRGQFYKFTETLANTVALSPTNEVPPVSNATASGTATITVNPTRNNVGQVNGGNVTLSVLYDMPPNSEIIGLHIHKQVVGMNGDVVIDSGLSSSNSIVTPTGKGTISITVPVKGNAVEALKQLVSDPAGFYVNIHTRAQGSGLMRGQLTSVATPPVIHVSDTTFLTTATGTVTRFELMVTGYDAGSTVLINGQAVSASQWQFAFNGGRLLVDIQPSLRAAAGTLSMQLRNSQGLLSAPYTIVVAPENKINPIPVTTVDGARYGNLVAPEAIVSAFGTRLASQAVGATDPPLPNSLDGTFAYINGVAASLFFVSDQQANYLMPSTTLPGPTDVVFVAKDGTVSRGMVNVAATIPAIFTRNSTGAGAPAAIASADGQNFNIPVSNPDGSPAAIDAGNYVELFGTGMRFGSTGMTINIGGVQVTPLFFGPQGFYEGLDQVNLRIPQSLAGAGDVDLVLTLDGKTSNTVKLKIK